jgi:hypothetical protein
MCLRPGSHAGGIYGQRFVTCWVYYVEGYHAAQEFGSCRVFLLEGDYVEQEF